MLCACSLQVNAQPVASANNMALGGGGAAYLSGYEANFYNPANLAIYDRPGRLHFGIGNIGGYFQPVLASNSLRDQISGFRNIYIPFRVGSQLISSSEQSLILDRHYPRNRLTSQHLSRVDAIPVGVLWQGEKMAYSLALRSRIGTRTDVGRGWYSNKFIDHNDASVRSFHLAVQNQVLYEISLGLAHEIEFFNGLFPRINRLFVGIAPKFIIGGSYLSSVYEGRYERPDTQANNSDPVYITRFTHRSSGDYSRMVHQFRASGNLQASINRHLNDDFFIQPTGYGVGMDFGLTYLIPLGSDVSLLTTGENRQPINRSFRISLSVTDLGLMYYDDSPLSVESSLDTTQLGQQEPLSSAFIGAPGQFSAYFEEADSLTNPLLQAQNLSENTFLNLLPATINAGALLDLDRLKLMADLTLALNRTAFSGTQLTAHFGMEARPLPNIPVRLGTLIAPRTPIRVGLGTGLETKNWNFSLSTQVLLRAGSLTSHVAGGAVAGLQLHL